MPRFLHWVAPAYLSWNVQQYISTNIGNSHPTLRRYLVLLALLELDRKASQAAWIALRIVGCLLLNFWSIISEPGLARGFLQ